MNPVIRRVGGKFYSRKKIIQVIPEHDTYVEPFVGGGSIFYGKNPSKIEVINDLDTEVYHCHVGAKEAGHLGECYVLVSKEEFNAVKKSKPVTPVDILVRMNILQNNSYLGSCNTYLDDKRTTGKKEYQKYADRLKDTIILNESYENLFRYDSPTTFFYLDPPYENSKKTTCNAYQSIDYQALRDRLKNLQGKFLLSINDSPTIRELFKDFTIQETTTVYSVKKRLVIELLIKNY